MQHYLVTLPEEKDCRDAYKRTPLMWAAKTGNAKLVWLLLDAGADPFKIDKDRRNLLHWLGLSDHPDAETLFGDLISRLPMPVLRQKSDLDGSPLCVAVQKGWVRSAERLEKLLGKRELFRKRKDGLFLLHVLMISHAEGLLPFLRKILSIWCDVRRPLDVLPEAKHSGFVCHKALQNLTPLMLAGRLGRAEYFQELLSAGSDPLYRSPHQGLNAFDHAIMSNCTEMTEKICRHPLISEPGIQTRLWFISVLHGNEVMICQLLLAGFFINQFINQKDEGIGKGDENALHYAARAGRSKIWAFLIAGGIDQNLRNHQGKTPAMIAEEKVHGGVGLCN